MPCKSRLHRTQKLYHLTGGEIGRHAHQGRDYHQAVGQILGRRGRAHHCRGSTGRIERDFCRHRLLTGKHASAISSEVVFSADLFSAVAATPYLAFHTVANESGTLSLLWESDKGFSQTETINLALTA